MKEIIVELCRIQQDLLPTELDRVGPPVVDGRGQSDHKDQGVDPQDPDGVLLLYDPGGETDSKLHGLGTVGVAVVLVVVLGRLICQRLVCLVQQHELLLRAAGFVGMDDKRLLSERAERKRSIRC